MTTPASVPTMTLALQRYHGTEPLIDGTVTADNILVVNAAGGSTKALGVRHGAFDAAEVPFVRYVFWKSRGGPSPPSPSSPTGSSNSSTSIPGRTRGSPAWATCGGAG